MFHINALLPWDSFVFKAMISAMFSYQASCHSSNNSLRGVEAVVILSLEISLGRLENSKANFQPCFMLHEPALFPIHTLLNNTG